MARSSLLLAALAVVAVGCDAVDGAAPSDPASASKLRLWDAATPEAPTAAKLAIGDSIDFFVTFVPGTDPEEGSDEVFEEQDVRRRGYVTESTPGVAATVAVWDFDAVMGVLEASPIVLWVEPDLPVSFPELDLTYVPLSRSYTGQATDLAVAALNAPFSGQMLPWNVTLIGGDRSSTRSGDGSGAVDVDVYVIDSGVDHPDVNVVESVRFFPVALGDGPTTHGNHVAAILAATDDRRGVVGVAPGARVHSLDVFDANGGATMSRLIEAVDYVTAAKRAAPSRPVVANMSVGARTGTASLNALDEAVQAAVEAGVVFVVSAGNAHENAADYSPAHTPEALTVGAYDANRVFALDFSNAGPLVDLLAPGVRIVSAADGGRYAMLDGTSMAAPHVAGAAALYLARNPGATPAQVARALLSASRATVTLTGFQTTNRTVWVGGL